MTAPATTTIPSEMTVLFPVRGARRTGHTFHWPKYATPERNAMIQRARLFMSSAELAVWDIVRCKAFQCCFHRKALVLGWIVDFWCPSLGLAIDLHFGSYTNRPDKRAMIERRATMFTHSNITILQVPPSLVMSDPASVCAKIAHTVSALRAPRNI